MAAKKIHHHFVPHVHSAPDGAEQARQHRAHFLDVSALFSYALVFSLLSVSLFAIRVSAPKILGIASFSAEQIVALTNAKRVENGLPALSHNLQLASAASTKSGDMFTSDYWSHNSPSGKTPWSFVSAAGYKYIYAGENLARDFNDAQSVVNAWMNSPSHRSNILDKNFKEIGVSVSEGKLDGREGVLVVQIFGTAISQISAPLAQASPTPAASPQTVAQALPAGRQESSKAEIRPSPSPQPLESPSASPSEAPVVIAQIQDIVAPQEKATVLASRQFSIAKAASFAMIGFIFMLFLLEVIVVYRHAHLKMRSGTLAHLGLLGFILLVVWYAVQGAVI